MTKNLVIVESPAKAKTIEKYLGPGNTVLASYGHVRDLVPKEGAVDPDNNFAMRYEVTEKNSKHVEAIAKSMKSADCLILATDPDREGEAIAWSVQELMIERKLLKDKPVKRVVFHEITKSAILEAMMHPREVAMPLVHAQQARRALDYLVGFKLSPLLWQKVRRGLSAGRVQSPALRLIVEREEEIERFKTEEYWTLHAHLLEAKQEFTAKLQQYQGEKLTQFSITHEEQATIVQDTLSKAAGDHLLVVALDKKQRKRQPAAPFITSTVQQEAARKLGFTAKRTMMIAQQLYEGIDIGEGAAGLISYMRTDSVNLAQEAVNEIRAYIAKHYGERNVPKTQPVYKTKSKNAQEAHEAIRPTSVLNVPDKIKKYLSAEQYKLYALIWKRTVASQMIHATLDTVAVDLAAGEGNIFRANGSVISDPGFITVYQEDKDDAKPQDDNDTVLPVMTVGQQIPLEKIVGTQHFTEPPPRYSEASLVKALEEHGIGRPSTYASIISTLQNREYVFLDKKRFIPTDVGRVVNRFLTRFFTTYVDYDFTAKLEDDLDAVSRAEKEWIPVLEQFWQPFKKQIALILETVERKDVTQEAMDEACPKCGKPLSIRLGRKGRFIGCTTYPECDYTRNLESSSTVEPEIVEGRTCEKCGKPLLIREGRFGKFIGCSGYPDCRYLEPIEKPSDTKVPCPKCKQGNILQRKSRRGKIFYSCNRYPDCDYALWDEPLAEPCPNCHWPILTLKMSKRKGREKICPQKECGYTLSLDEE